MIGEYWQTVLALLCVGAALFVLVRRAIALFGGVSGGCASGGCGTCEHAGGPAEGPDTDGFVSIDVLIPSTTSQNDFSGTGR